MKREKPMSNVLYETDNYFVLECDNALGEDGKYGVSGYAVVNKKTDVTEHTSMMLPGAIFQAQHFSDTLDSLLADKGPVAPPIDMSAIDVEDVVPN
jgi:hypothetical protein